MKEMVVERSRLAGEVRIAGAKNSVLKLMTASLLTSDPVVIENYPSELSDAQIHFDMLIKLGKACRISGDELYIEEQPNSLTNSLEWHGRSIRNTLLILGALVARFGEGKVPLPGGCKLGERGYDIHAMVLRAMGAEVWVEGGTLNASSQRSLVGADIHLPLRSTGATENALICGCLAQGITTIWNPHVRPELLDLVTFLTQMGAKIEVFGQERIVVRGIEQFSAVRHRVMPDNMEAVTWLVGAVMTGGDVEIHDFPSRDLEVALIHLRESGARFFYGPSSLIVRGGCCYPLEISTGPHPAINSDVQPILAAYASCAKGESRITDLRFRGRYAYADELAKFGVSHVIEGDMLKIRGKGRDLIGAHVRATDLRAGAALALCGLVASGETRIADAWQIERGYAGFVAKLKSLGANVCAG